MSCRCLFAPSIYREILSHPQLIPYGLVAYCRLLFQTNSFALGLKRGILPGTF